MDAVAEMGAQVDQAIDQVEKLYQAVTGGPVPREEGAYAQIPAEKDPVRHVEEQVDRLLTALGSGVSASPAPWAPTLLVWENEKEILVQVDLPGVNRDRIQVRTAGNVLTITGERPAPGSSFRLSAAERPVGRFRRTLLVPALRTAEPNARFADGVLEIRIPRDAKEGAARSVNVV